jgi:O-antigen/teichoic acid export membrane protein
VNSSPDSANRLFSVLSALIKLERFSDYMDIAKRLTINAFFIMVAKGLQPIVSFFMIMVIGRKLGVTVFGIYSTAISYILIFQIVASFGLRTLITREVAKHRDQVASYLVNSLYIAIPLSLVAGLIMCIFVLFIIKLDAETARITCLLGFSLLASSIIECFEGVLAGFEKIQTISYIYVIENFVKVGICILLLYLGFQIVTVIIVHIVTRYLAVLLYVPSILKLTKKARILPDGRFIKSLLRTAYIFAMTMIIVTIYWNIDIVLINKMQGNVDAGIYSGAKRFVLFLITLIQSFFTAFFPVISELYESHVERFQEACKKSLLYLMIAAVPITVIMTLLADKIFYVTFGTGFEESVWVLIILVWIIIPYSISQVFAYALLASNNQRFDLRVNAIALLCNGFLSWLFIKNFSYKGAAIASLISILVYVGLQTPFIFKNIIKFDMHRLGVVAGKVAIGGFIMIGIILLLNKMNLFGVMFFSTMIYFSVLFLVKVFSEEDLQFFKRILKRRTA